MQQKLTWERANQNDKKEKHLQKKIENMTMVGPGSYYNHKT